MRAARYVRVSTDEQARSGYSIADQLRTLRHHAESNGYEVIEELKDDGYSGASIDRPGLMRVYKLAAEGVIDIVLATKRDRLFRNQLYRLQADRDLKDHGVRLVSLDDTGNKIGDSVLDSYAEWYRDEFIQKSRAGKRERAFQGMVIPHHHKPYGFRYTMDRTNFEVDEATMSVVRRMFGMIAGGTSLSKVCDTLDAERVPTPGDSHWWNPITVRRILQSDLYRPHTIAELGGIVGADVLARKDPTKQYGVWWFGKNRVEGRDNPKPTKDGIPRANASSKPRRFVKQDDPIPVPIPDAGIPREWVEAAHAYLQTTYRWRGKPGARYYELRGHVYCGACGGSMTSYHNNGYYYHSCIKRRNKGRKACPQSHNLNANRAEEKIMRDVTHLLRNPDRIIRRLDEAITRETAATNSPPLEARRGQRS